jgi:hypothetical protein
MAPHAAIHRPFSGEAVDYGGGENPFKGMRWPIQPR